eukprot:m.163440 g.163440  ORF g.163440 m.163440 type:complete len:106 (-) comp9878_c0_seq4:1918-2235(-)
MASPARAPPSADELAMAWLKRFMPEVPESDWNLAKPYYKMKTLMNAPSADRMMKFIRDESLAAAVFDELQLHDTASDPSEPSTPTHDRAVKKKPCSIWLLVLNRL